MSSITSPTLTLLASLLSLLLLAPLTTAHFSIEYPSWRGNTLRDEMQWQYPCGGMDITTNRTKWPITGGKLSIIPGWNAGHPTAFFYVNMGFGTKPVNHSNPMIGVYQVTGPSRDAYAGQYCMTHVPMPANFNISGLKVGDNATIQVIQVALHGGSLYNCADVTLVDAEDADVLPDERCKNTTTIGFNQVYTTRSKSAGVKSMAVPVGMAGVVALVTWGIYLVGGQL